jgi:ABC-type uncharacterized transport system substrate-binding protein
MSKRIVVGLLAAVILATIPPAEAQQRAKISRIGLLSSTGDLRAPGPSVEAFRQALRDLGYNEGKNISIEYRYAEGNQERLSDLVAELVKLKPDVLVVTALTAVRAAKQATKTIPVVMVILSDSGRHRDSRESGAPGRQYHGAHQTHPGIKRQTAGIASGDGSASIARRSALGRRCPGSDCRF